jgi:hypothetical protein
LTDEHVEVHERKVNARKHPAVLESFGDFKGIAELLSHVIGTTQRKERGRLGNPDPRGKTLVTGAGGRVQSGGIVRERLLASARPEAQEAESSLDR